MGGIKEKLIGAREAGITTIYLPAKNLKDTVELPDEVKRDLAIHPVETMDELIRVFFASAMKEAPKGRGVTKGSRSSGKG